ncbi:MAG: hypothetical protein QOH27_4706 [Mycobacterium sp.]|jgi:hypothetical protein|nr:hypothetical protein [Mycobacterium sp.]
MAVAAAAGSTLLAIAVPQVMAAPTTDASGYVDSTARCASPDTAVAFGSTDSSRVAICKSSSGKYEYRGVRLRDGAKLILPATASGGGFVAESDGITYTVTASSLAVRSGNQAVRDEPMVDFHGDLPKTSPVPSSAPAPAPAPAPAAAPTPTPPLPPPLPAEVGG